MNAPQNHKLLWGAMALAIASLSVGLGLLGLSETPKLALFGATCVMLALPLSLGTCALRLQFPGLKLAPAWLRRQLSARLFQGLVLSSLPAALWLAHEHQVISELTYARATSPSEATKEALRGLEKPLTVRLFAPPASELRAQLEPYLVAVRQAAPQVQIKLHDQAAEPALANALGVYHNGTITMTLGRGVDESIPPPETKRATRALELGQSAEASRAALRSLDEQFLATLRALTERRRHIYVIEGADELSWREAKTSASTQTLYKIMTELLYAEVTPLPLEVLEREGAPKDADLLLWTGPKRALKAPALDALSAYLDQGGALWLLVDPEAPSLSGATQQASATLTPLLKQLGIKLNQEAVASETGNAPLTRSKADRLNLLLTHVEAHPAAKGLLEGAGQMALLVTLGGALEVIDATRAKGLVWTPRAWLDQDGDLELDEAERQGKWAMVVASERSSWRAVTVADAQVVSDESMLRSPGNQQLAQDILLWLLRMERGVGQTHSAQDVRVSFEQGAARWWRWAAILCGPLLCLLLAAACAIWRARPTRGMP